MDFDLNVYDRIILLNVLPDIRDVDLTLYGCYHNLIQELSFSEGEHLKFQITHNEDNSVKWTNDETKKIDIGHKMLNIIQGRLKACKEKELLEYSHKSLYEKFAKDE